MASSVNLNEKFYLLHICKLNSAKFVLKREFFFKVKFAIFKCVIRTEHWSIFISFTVSKIRKEIGFALELILLPLLPLLLIFFDREIDFIFHFASVLYFWFPWKCPWETYHTDNGNVKASGPKSVVKYLKKTCDDDRKCERRKYHVFKNKDPNFAVFFHHLIGFLVHCLGWWAF